MMKNDFVKKKGKGLQARFQIHLKKFNIFLVHILYIKYHMKYTGTFLCLHVRKYVS